MTDTITTVLIGLLAAAALAGTSPAQLSPFVAMREEQGRIEAQLAGDETWYEVVSMDGVAMERIVAHARKAYGTKWWKRITEDLQDVMGGLGVAAGRTADLELRRAGEKKVVKRDDVPMTSDNRRALWAANNRGGRDRRRRRDVVKPVLRPGEVAEDLTWLKGLLDQRHSYRHRLGVDLDAALAESRRRLGEGPVEGSVFAREVIRTLALLGDGHTGVRSGRRYFPAGYSQFLVEEIGGRFLAIRPDRRGFFDARHPWLESLGGRPVEDWLEAVSPFVTRGSPQFARRRAVRSLRFLRLIQEQLGLEPAGEIEAVFVDDSGKKRKRRTLGLSHRYPTYGAWPRSETRVLDGNVGYLRLPAMESGPELVASLDDAMSRFRKTRGLIIDVRGNGGGSRTALRTLLPYLMKLEDEPRVANVAAYRLAEGDDPAARDGYLENRWLYPVTWKGWSPGEVRVIKKLARTFEPDWSPPKGQFSAWHYMLVARSDNPRAYHYQAPVVILQDHDCFSATDVFLGAFRGWRGVTLMGRPSGGGSGRRLGYRMPRSGLEIRVSSMASYQPTGEIFEGRGVHPDVVVEPAPADFIGRGDAVLDAAVNRLLGR